MGIKWNLHRARRPAAVCPSRRTFFKFYFSYHLKVNSWFQESKEPNMHLLFVLAFRKIKYRSASCTCPDLVERGLYQPRPPTTPLSRRQGLVPPAQGGIRTNNSIIGKVKSRPGRVLALATIGLVCYVAPSFTRNSSACIGTKPGPSSDIAAVESEDEAYLIQGADWLFLGQTGEVFFYFFIFSKFKSMCDKKFRVLKSRKFEIWKCVTCIFDILNVKIWQPRSANKRNNNKWNRTT